MIGCSVLERKTCLNVAQVHLLLVQEKGRDMSPGDGSVHSCCLRTLDRT